MKNVLYPLALFAFMAGNAIANDDAAVLSVAPSTTTQTVEATTVPAKTAATTGGLFDQIEGKFNDFFTKVKGFFSRQPAQVAAPAQSATPPLGVSEQVEKATQAVKEKATAIGKTAKQKATELGDAAKQKAQEVSDAVKAQAQEVADVAQAKAQEISAAAQAKAQEISAAAQTKLEQLKAAAVAPVAAQAQSPVAAQASATQEAEQIAAAE